MGNPNKQYNLVRVLTSTTGTGTMTLGSAISGFLTPAAAGASDGDVVSYSISDGVNSEIGQGTYHSSGTTLSRDIVYTSTASGAKITLSGNAILAFTTAREDFNALAPLPTFTNYAFTDQSGAGLTLTTLIGFWSLVGKLCFIEAIITYPTNTNTLRATFSMPFQALSHPTTRCCGSIISNIYLDAAGAGPTTAFPYLDSGVNLRNIDLSGQTINFNITYRIP